MKISVVIASYNGASYIADQLLSIINQTTPPHEIIVSDDSSTDPTADVVAAIAAEHRDIDICFSTNPPPHGVDRNFEHAISLASGDVIFIADQDDVWLPDRIESMIHVFEKSSAPVATFCDSRIVDSKLNDLGYTHLQSRGFSSPAEVFEDNCMGFLKRVPPAGHDMAFHSEFRKLLLPFPELDNCYDTWIGMVLFAVGAWKLSAAAPLTLFRRHSGSVSQSGLIPSWKEKIAQAKRSIADDTAGWNAELYSKLIERTGNLLTPEMRKLLEARQAHSQARSRMNIPFFRRLKMVLKETLNGNYFRFGRSYQNIIQDLFFRHPESKK